jgi:hypothetical protein
MRKFCLTVCIATGAVMALHAQTPTSSDARSADAKSVTVTGCIERAAQMPTGTAGAAGTAAPAPKFILAKATAGSSSPTGTAGSTTPSSSATAPQYRFDDADESKLAPHVGHKVEITGTIDDQGRSATGAPGAPSASSSSAASPKLKVDSVKMIAASCSDK